MAATVAAHEDEDATHESYPFTNPFDEVSKIAAS